jgi:tetratricopeptide (TPR) repeat protein
VADVVGRAYGNRGNARSRQGKLQAALADYNTSIQLCPWSVDPVLNRGVALEALGRFEGAQACWGDGQCRADPWSGGEERDKCH